MSPLATIADLEGMLGRVLEADELPSVEQVLVSASEAVREASGQLFTRLTTTIALPATSSGRIRLPQQPVVAVTDVTIAGEPVDGWRFVGGELWHGHGWGRLPEDVTVTYTHGYTETPRPVRDLVLALALAAGRRLEDEGMLGATPGIRQESISNNAHAITYGSDVETPVSVFDLPARTRMWLRDAYGAGTAAVVGSR